MSTFDGIVKEFPDIKIDYFRQSSEHSRPPLAYLLSHVHSDHLAGLESCKSPFIYCSPATREILLRLEKYPHRMNFAKGILETRKQTYRHLKNLLKPIPLETPTVIELTPGKTIRVTLFDANHCVGAVVFLIEGDGKAVMYTGDIRSEPWWVTALARHPLLLPYVSAGSQSPLKRLDTMYLDTTFAHRSEPYQHFPTKAEGLTELLLAVSKYPENTLFYFDSWTFGYEDVWQALSAHLGSQVHVDDYRYGMYASLANGSEPRAPEVAKLLGFHCGNHFQEGCLSARPTQLHSCEKGTGCDIWKKDFVRITPIISRHNGVDMAELGAGGGQGDLDQRHELEVGDTSLVGQLIALCATKLQGQPEIHASVMEKLTSIINRQVQSISLDGLGLTDDAGAEDDFINVDELPLERLVPALAKLAAQSKQKQGQQQDDFAGRRPSPAVTRADGLPKQITFPYSRHSSYAELCDLVEAFKPNDVHPCTVDYANWTPANSMDYLFGHLYTMSSPTFSHDQVMFRTRGASKPAVVSTTRPPTAESGSSGNAKSSDDAGSRRRGSRGRRREERRREERRATIDHYSPPPSPPTRKRKSISQTPISDNDVLSIFRKEAAELESRASALNTSAPPSAPGQRRAWGEHGTASVLANWRPDSNQAKIVQSSEYGRLSPPPAKRECKIAGSTLRPTDHGERESLPRQSSTDDLPSQSERSKRRDARSESEQADLDYGRMTMQNDAYLAAQGDGGLQWSDIGLISSGGHQVKEEEL